MNLSRELKSIRQSAEAIGQRIQAMQAQGVLQRPSTMNPNEPLRHHKRGPLVVIKATAFRFAFSTTRTSKSLEPQRHGVKIMAGLNELDAEISLRQYLTKDGLHLHTILSMEKVR